MLLDALPYDVKMKSNLEQGNNEDISSQSISGQSNLAYIPDDYVAAAYALTELSSSKTSTTPDNDGTNYEVDPVAH